MSTIVLASGQIAKDAELSVQLTRAKGREICLLVWPSPIAVKPAQLSQTVATITRILANGSLELAACRVRGHPSREQHEQ
jgi:hypothetical protein